MANGAAKKWILASDGLGVFLYQPYGPFGPCYKESDGE
jgi:hypothetical protein